MTTKHGAAVSLSQPVFAPNAGIVCIPAPTKKDHDNKVFLWSICMIVRYVQGLHASYGLVYSFAGAQFVLSCRFGDGKLSNEIAHETKMSRFTD